MEIKLQSKVKELEKRLEMMRISYDERLNLALDGKDKDQMKLQERLQQVMLES